MPPMSKRVAREIGPSHAPASSDLAERGTRSETRTPLWLVAALWAGFVVGFVVALGAVAHPRWYPILDMAQTEMRVRDVFSAQPPFIGLPGRIGTLGARQGSHPGPLSFWVLAPFYRVFGSSAWALQVAAACVNALVIGATLLVVRRRGGRVVVLGFSGALAALIVFYGPDVLTQGWNPYMPVLWFILFVVGVWSVLCDDLAMLPVATFAACFCLHTHISYLGMVGGIGMLAVVWIAWSLWCRRPALGAHPWRWIMIAIGILVATSIPPIIQELTHEPGNLTLIWEHFTNPPDEPIGERTGLEVLLVHLNPWRLLARQDANTGSLLPGATFVVAWAVGAMIAIRRRVGSLIALNAVIAVGLVLGLMSIANIFGFIWYYLMLWAWGLSALMLLTTAWAIGLFVTTGARRNDSRVVVRMGWLLVVAVSVVSFARFSDAASTLESPSPRLSEALDALVGPTVAAIDAGRVPGGGRAGRYQVTIKDPVTINGPGYGLLSELERSGIHAGFPQIFDAIVRDSRVVTKNDATAVVHFSVGPDIAVWNAIPGAVRVATVDVRPAAERREFRRLQRSLGPRLRAIGRGDLVPNLTANIFTATFVVGLPADVSRDLIRMVDIGEPAAVFVGPPTLAE